MSLPKTTQDPYSWVSTHSTLCPDQFLDLMTGGAVLKTEDQPPGFEMYEPVETGTNG